MKSTLAIGAAFAAAVIMSSVCAADELTKRQLPKRVDLTGSRETKVIVAQIEIAPGGKVLYHPHNRDEFFYVLRGDGQRARQTTDQFQRGQTIHFPRGKLHGGFSVAGTTSFKAITTHLVDKGKSPIVALRLFKLVAWD